MIDFPDALALMANLRSQSVRMEPRRDKLHVEPASAVTPEVREALLAHKPTILRLLRLPSDVPPHLLAVREARDRLRREGGRFLLVSRIDRELNIGAYTVARCLDALDALEGATTPPATLVQEVFGTACEGSGPCPHCGGRDWWVSRDGVRACRVCRPPARDTEAPDCQAG